MRLVAFVAHPIWWEVLCGEHFLCTQVLCRFLTHSLVFVWLILFIALMKEEKHGLCQLVLFWPSLSSPSFPNTMMLSLPLLFSLVLAAHTQPSTQTLEKQECEVAEKRWRSSSSKKAKDGEPNDNMRPDDIQTDVWVCGHRENKSTKGLCFSIGGLDHWSLTPLAPHPQLSCWWEGFKLFLIPSQRSWSGTRLQPPTLYSGSAETPRLWWI